MNSSKRLDRRACCVIFLLPLTDSRKFDFHSERECRVKGSVAGCVHAYHDLCEPNAKTKQKIVWPTWPHGFG